VELLLVVVGCTVPLVVVLVLLELLVGNEEEEVVLLRLLERKGMRLLPDFGLDVPLFLSLFISSLLDPFPSPLTFFLEVKIFATYTTTNHGDEWLVSFTYNQNKRYCGVKMATIETNETQQGANTRHKPTQVYRLSIAE